MNSYGTVQDTKVPVCTVRTVAATVLFVAAAIRAPRLQITGSGTGSTMKGYEYSSELTS